jgi:NADP-dependent 3-hydroxy acid dehydrogenase YdfG
MSGIEGKTVAITGAGGGIGSATAAVLAGRGARVVLADLHVEPLQRLAAKIESAGGEVAVHSTDVTRGEDLATLVKVALDRFGRLDVLVANAGIGPISPMDDIRVADWERMIDVNVKGVLYGVAAALPVFRKQGVGHFVNVASVAGMGGHVSPNMAVYGATKLAVRAISEGLRVEAGDKLRVTVISPGFVRTAFTEGIANDEVRERLNATRDRMAIPPDAIARAIAFAIEQPTDVDVNEIVVRPTAQA